MDRIVVAFANEEEEVIEAAEEELFDEPAPAEKKATDTLMFVPVRKRAEEGSVQPEKKKEAVFTASFCYFRFNFCGFHPALSLCPAHFPGQALQQPQQPFFTFLRRRRKIAANAVRMSRTTAISASIFPLSQPIIRLPI